jgi:hypothetical protein
MQPISRTVGPDRVVGERLVRLNSYFYLYRAHAIKMNLYMNLPMTESSIGFSLESLLQEERCLFQ